jgi:hypothetical protein
MTRTAFECFVARARKKVQKSLPMADPVRRHRAPIAPIKHRKH